MSRALSRSGLAAVLLAAALAAGCSNVNPENYAKIQGGMARDQVYEVLGQPDDVAGGGLGALSVSAETWKGPKHTIHITFAGDKVALKTITASGAESKER